MRFKLLIIGKDFMAYTCRDISCWWCHPSQGADPRCSISPKNIARPIISPSSPGVLIPNSSPFFPNQYRWSDPRWWLHFPNPCALMSTPKSQHESAVVADAHHLTTPQRLESRMIAGSIETDEKAWARWTPDAGNALIKAPQKLESILEPEFGAYWK